MTPVISPWVFYLMPICENLSDVAWFVSFASTIALVGFFFAYVPAVIDEDEEMMKTLGKFIKKLLPLLVISTLFSCLIPSEETLTKMIVAQNVTVERVDMVSDTVVTVYNDIMNLFSGATNG